MIARGLTFLIAAAVVLDGCGGSVKPIDVAAGCPEQSPRSPAALDKAGLQLIDDFETHDKKLAKVSPRDGYWVLGQDGTAVVSIAEPSGTCVARGSWSGHFAARGFTGWGSNWTAVFMATGVGGAAVPYDARGWGGISFWAAFGADNGADFPVPLGVTTLDNAWNGGVCSNCEDYYRTMVALTHDWRRYEIRFSDLRQEGWGVPQVPTMRRDQMVGFIIWPRQQFDIWIDDVHFEP